MSKTTVLSKSYKYLHIIPDSIFAEYYINKINELYESNDHLFIVHTYNGKRFYSYDNCYLTRRMDRNIYAWILKYNSDIYTVIFHYLPTDWDVQFFFGLLPFEKRINFLWYIWSSDLYKTYEKESSICGLSVKARIKRYTRYRLIKKMKGLIVLAPQDYYNAKMLYKINPIMYQADYPEKIVDLAYKRNTDSLVVLAGHESSKSLLHKQMFDRIKNSNEKEIKVISIFSYGGSDLNYINSIIDYGRRLFGANFTAITEYMPYNDYINLLNNVDVALFEADVQSGTSNILNLLALGKKVYLSQKNTFYPFMRELGISIFDKESFTNTYYEALTTEEIQNNKKIIREFTSDTTFKRKWDMVFFDSTNEEMKNNQNG